MTPATIQKRDLLIDKLEVELLKQEQVACPLRHIFTPGLYVREIFMPAGVMMASSVHKFKHPFVISQGRFKVYLGEESFELAAPHTGITEAGTRRVFYILEDTILSTFHVTDTVDVEELEKELLVDYKNELVDQDVRDEATRECRSQNMYIRENLLDD